jgi:uncharacterized protein (TIRG00374 family)
MSRKRLLSLLKLAIAAGLVAWVLSRVELTDWVDAKGERHRGLLTYVREMDVALFLGGCLLYFLPASFSSVRWWWLMRVNGLGITPGQALRYTWIGIFWNNVVPGLTGGDVVKAVYAVRASGKKLRPVMTVLVDRLIGLLALALLAAIVVLFRLDNRDFRLIAAGLWGGFLVLLVAVCVLLSRRARRALRLDDLLRRLPGSKVFMQLDQALQIYRGHVPGLLLWLLISVVDHLVAVAGVILVHKALGGGMPTGEILILVPIINIISAVPLAPAGWGIGEALYDYLWRRFGFAYMAAEVAATQGVALSIVYRVQTTLWSLLGAIFMIFEKGRPTTSEVDHLMDDESDAGEPSVPPTAGEGAPPTARPVG